MAYKAILEKEVKEGFLEEVTLRGILKNKEVLSRLKKKGRQEYNERAWHV